MSNSSIIKAHPIRIIPFDLGVELNERHEKELVHYVEHNFNRKTLSPRQKAILREHRTKTKQ